MRYTRQMDGEKADYVVKVSAASDHMKGVVGIRKNIDVVQLGFVFETLDPNNEERKRIRDEFGFAETDFAIGYVANFAPAKRQIRRLSSVN